MWFLFSIKTMVWSKVSYSTEISKVWILPLYCCDFQIIKKLKINVIATLNKKQWHIYDKIFHSCLYISQDLGSWELAHPHKIYDHIQWNPHHLKYHKLPNKNLKIIQLRQERVKTLINSKKVSLLINMIIHTC